jgi:predicted KAP-like P-loop ATPase
VAKKASGLALTAHTGIPSPGQIRDLVHIVHALIPESLKKEKDGVESAKDLKGLLKPRSPKRTPNEIEEFRKAFDKLLTAAGIDQLVVLIDGLDRCLPDTAIETLEAVRLFVFTARPAFVVAADEAMIEYAVRKHFPDLADTTGPMTYSRNYLEKLLQVPFRIPALGENDPAFNKLATSAPCLPR